MSEFAKLVASFKEPLFVFEAPQSELISATSAAMRLAAWLKARHPDDEEAMKTIERLERFHRRVVALPGLSVRARRYLDDLESYLSSKETSPTNNEGNRGDGREDTTFITDLH